MPAILGGIRTEFHGTGTTSMLPLELGGVVDNRLRVYGTHNLRIVDAGIFPLVPAAHLQASVYAVSEKVRATHLIVRTIWGKLRPFFQLFNTIGLDSSTVFGQLKPFPEKLRRMGNDSSKILGKWLLILPQLSDNRHFRKQLLTVFYSGCRYHQSRQRQFGALYHFYCCQHPETHKWHRKCLRTTDKSQLLDIQDQCHDDRFVSYI